MNILVNASEAIADKDGNVTLRTGFMDCDAAYLRRSRLEEKPAPGRFVFLEVTDTGCGMDANNQRRLFDPFFTTKFTGRGLGMSAVQGIMRAHKGAFLVESRPGVGTTIQVLFPIANYQPASPATLIADNVAPGRHIGHTLKVLVVDDEEIIRAVTVSMLDELGYETLVAESGDEALKIFRREGASINVVLLDQVMPGMDGVTVFKELRSIQPGIKVLLASGFSQQEVSERFRGLGLNGFIQKPYALKSLEAELSRVLKMAES